LGPPDPQSPFDAEGPAQGQLWCYEVALKNGKACFKLNGFVNPRPLNSCEADVEIDVSVPRLIAAIDPVQENKLLPLDRTIVTGRALTQSTDFGLYRSGSGTVFGVTLPVVVSTRSYVDESLRISADLVTASSSAVDAAIQYDLPASRTLTAINQTNADHYALVSALPARPIGNVTMNPEALFEQTLPSLTGTSGGLIGAYWTLRPIQYVQLNGVMSPRTLPLDPSPWLVNDQAGVGGYPPLPPSNQDTQFHEITPHAGLPLDLAPAEAQLDVVGMYDPSRLPGFDPLSAVPLPSYRLPEALPADALSRQALGSRAYLPTRNIGGYLSQPPFLLTTLTAARGLTNGSFFQPANPGAPISVIRLRIAGVHGIDRLSLQRIQTAASLIHQRTGLDVDITAGSSPTPTLVRLPASSFGAPSLLLDEDWVKKGVALVILTAEDRKTLLLIGLMLMATIVFLSEAGLASVRARRREIGVLICVGWHPLEIFASILSEMAVIGLVAGLAGTGLAVLVGQLAHFHRPLWSLVLATPVAVVVTTIAGFIPALLAARGQPLDAINPSVWVGRTARRVRTIEGLAWLNLRRIPARSLLAAAALAAGVTALTLLLAVTVTFRGAISGTLLGDFVVVQARDVDYVVVALMILFATAALSEVLTMSTRERAVELATLRATGWSSNELMRLVGTEGIELGLIGSVSGASIGLAGGLILGGQFSSVISPALLAGVVGLAATLLATAIPSALVSRMPVTELSAEA
jgi:hypothetical protein